MILEAKPILNELDQELKEEIGNKKLLLSVVYTGSDPASEVYMRAKKKLCDKLGVATRFIEIKPNAKDLQLTLQMLRDDREVDGILVEQPLRFEADLSAMMDPDKDVDCISYENMGRLFLSNSKLYPATAAAVMQILKYYKIDVASKDVVVVGRSPVIGKPVSMMLMKENATVQILHSRSKNAKEKLKNAELVVLAVGKADYLTEDMVTENTVIIDVGINVKDNKVVGDADFDSLVNKVSAITPVPGGVGPITNRMMIRNLIECSKRR